MACHMFGRDNQTEEKINSKETGQFEASELHCVIDTSKYYFIK